MSNFVSFETALRLRAAGFPQPAPDMGQVWAWPPDEGLHFIAAVAGVSAMHSIHIGLSTERVKDAGDFKDFAFAPGPAEILRELGPDYQCGAQGAYFWCGRMPSPHASVEENMAEACAKEWLYINEKKQ